MTRKELGKIKNVHFGHCGYQECGIGLLLSLGADGWDVCWQISAWDPQLIKHSKSCEWTEKDRDADLVKVVRKVSSLLKEAKVENVMDLKGKPVEVEFEGNTLKDWRLLTEVL